VINGEEDERRGRKLRDGDTLVIEGVDFEIVK
jgi:ribosome-associated protein YbcJ (S4-like RNA binding protein)